MSIAASSGLEHRPWLRAEKSPKGELTMESVFVKKVLPYRQIEDLAIAHRGEQRIFFNEGGTAIWGLLDGKRTPGDIACILAERNIGTKGLPEGNAKVSQFLTTLSRLGLVKEVHQNGSVQGTQFATGVGSREPSLADGAIRPLQDVCVTVRKASGAFSIKSETGEGTPPKIEDRFNDLYWEKLYIQKMHLELTYRCNFRCIQCYNTTHAGTESELTLAEWRSVLEQLAALGCHSVIFTGGEVFVRKDAVDILQVACDNRFSFRINTNGSLIDEGLIQRLEPMRPFLQSFDISFYGATPRVHDTLARRLGAYQATLRAVRLLAEAKMSLATKFVTMRDNFDGLAKWKSDMRELGVKHGLAMGTLIPRTDRNTAPLVQLLTDDQYKDLLAAERVDETTGAHFCRPGQIRGAITPDGGVSPCEWLTDFKFGNLRQGLLRDIWHSQESQSFRSIFEEDSDCPSCELRPGCSRCPAHSYLETGNLLHCAPSPRHYAEIYHQTKTVQ
jgi:radical SAM protein with 4Fe4S-binding SPASM domain